MNQNIIRSLPKNNRTTEVFPKRRREEMIYSYNYCVQMHKQTHINIRTYAQHTNANVNASEDMLHFFYILELGNSISFTADTYVNSQTHSSNNNNKFKHIQKIWREREREEKGIVNTQKNNNNNERLKKPKGSVYDAIIASAHTHIHSHSHTHAFGVSINKNLPFVKQYEKNYTIIMNNNTIISFL